MRSSDEQPLTTMYELVDTLEQTIKTAPPEVRERLSKVVDAYVVDCPDEFFWATGAQSPVLLYHLMMAIDTACRAEGTPKRRNVFRLVDRKPEGSA